jgi:hypothetical protein
MSLTHEQILANLKSAQNLALSSMGLPSTYDKTSFNWQQMKTYEKAYTSIILQHPNLFGEYSVAAAKSIMARIDEGPPEGLTISEASKIAVQSVEDSIVNLNQKLNPLASENLDTLKWFLILGAVGAVLYVAGPSLFSARKSLTERTRKSIHA